MGWAGWEASKDMSGRGGRPVKTCQVRGGVGGVGSPVKTCQVGGRARKLPVKTYQGMSRGVPGRPRKDMSGEE